MATRFFYVRRWLALTLVASLPAIGLGCAGDNGDSGPARKTFPATWAGIWSIERTERYYDLPDSTVKTEIDTLCAGAALWIWGFGKVPEECTGTVSDTMIDVAWRVEASCGLGWCTVDYTATIARHDDSMSGTVWADDSWGGRREIDLTGDRVGPAPTPCESHSSKDVTGEWVVQSPDLLSPR